MLKVTAFSHKKHKDTVQNFVTSSRESAGGANFVYTKKKTQMKRRN